MNKTVATVVVPLALGIAAAVFNLMAVRSATATVDLTVVKKDVKAGTPLTLDMLDKLTVRADPEVFRSAVRYEDCGVLVGRPASRSLVAKEVVLLADVRLSGTFDVRANLKPGERSLTVAVKSSRVVPGLRVGDEIEILVSTADPATKGVAAGKMVQPVGPFRVVGLGERADGSASSASRDEQQVVVAYTSPGAIKGFELLERAHRREGAEQVAGIEYAKAP